MTNNQAYNAVSVAAIPAQLVSSQPAKKGVAPWVGEHGFFQIPTEFSGEAAAVLSPRAQTVYIQHCSQALATGDGAGRSYAYRETLAVRLNCSLDTVDRANAELELAGLITETGRRFQHGGAVVYRLNAPSKWTLADRKNAATKPQPRDVQAAVERRKTKGTFQLKAKEQQTPLRSENVVVSIPSNESAPCPDTAALIARIVGEAQLSAAAAAKLIEQHGIEKVTLQLNWLPLRNPKSAPATFRASLKGDGWNSPHRMARPETLREPVRANAGAYDEHRPTAPVERQAPPKMAPPQVQVTPPRVAVPQVTPLRVAVPDETPRPDKACDAVFASLPDDVQIPVIEEAIKRAPGSGTAASRERLEMKRAFVWTHLRPQVELLGIQKGELMQ